MKGLPKILFVEDDISNRKVISDNLKYKYDILFAGSKEKALDLVNNENFDLIIIDVVIPEKKDSIADTNKMIGFDLMNEVRKIINDTPFIFVSSYKIEEINHRIGYELGADDYIERTDFNKFITIIDKKLEIYFKRKSIKYKIKEYLAEKGVSNKREDNIELKERIINCVKYLIENKNITKTEYKKLCHLENKYSSGYGDYNRARKDIEIMEKKDIIMSHETDHSYLLHPELKKFLNIN